MRITSLLGPGYLPSLEDLLFSHPHQHRFTNNIVDCVERYGSPTIVLRNNGLRIDLPRLADVQTLYALVDHDLVGIIVYTRTSNAALVVLHIVVREDYTLNGVNANDGIAVELVDAVCSVGHQIRGIQSVRLAYNRGTVILKPTSEPRTTHSVHLSGS